jgi:hypothetical protein
MLKFIIGIVLVIIFGYFVVTGLQEYFANQEELKIAEEDVKIAQDEFNKSKRELKAVFLEYYNCTYVNDDEYSCPPGTPDFETYCDPTKATYDREICRGTKTPS